MLKHITFLGGGNMANAIIAGLISHGHLPDHIHVIDRHADKRAALAQTYGVKTSTDDADAINTADIVIFAIKPQGFKTLMDEVGALLKARNPVIISIMSGLRLATLQSHLPEQAIIRVMPNTPARVQSGMSLLCADPSVNTETLATVQHIFDAVGQTFITPTERIFEQLTALTGCGPAFVFYMVKLFAQAMQEISPNIDCLPLAISTFHGAITLMQKETALTPDALIAQVSPKGGMTAEAMTVLQSVDVQALLKNTFLAAIKRGDELG